MPCRHACTCACTHARPVSWFALTADRWGFEVAGSTLGGRILDGKLSLLHASSLQTSSLASTSENMRRFGALDLRKPTAKKPNSLDANPLSSSVYRVEGLGWV